MDNTTDKNFGQQLRETAQQVIDARKAEEDAVYHRGASRANALCETLSEKLQQAANNGEMELSIATVDGDDAEDKAFVVEVTNFVVNVLGLRCKVLYTNAKDSDYSDVVVSW